MTSFGPKQYDLFKSINKRLGLLIILLLIAFFGAQFYMTSKIGTSNAAIEQIRIEKNSLRLENEILSAKVDESKSLTKIMEAASQLNLEPRNVTEIPAMSGESVAVSY